MERQVFVPSVNIADIEDLRGEQNYFKEIKRIEGKGKIVKFGKLFGNKNEAIDYINNTPSRRSGRLRSYIPDTNWVIRDSGDKVEAIAITSEVQGIRLDKTNLAELKASTLTDFDNFIFESLLVYEKEGVCPGINLKNFVIDEQDKLFYVDSEPFPPYTIKSFEMAHARKQTLSKLFGDQAKEKFPKTWEWVEKHEVANYRKAKREKRGPSAIDDRI